MSLKDVKKEQISMLKYWISVIVATFLAVAGFLIINVKSIDEWLIVVGCFCLVFLFVVGFFANQRVNKRIEDLKDL